VYVDFALPPVRSPERDVVPGFILDDKSRLVCLGGACMVKVALLLGNNLLGPVHPASVCSGAGSRLVRPEVAGSGDLYRSPVRLRQAAKV
jgi:hypothetical protein